MLRATLTDPKFRLPTHDFWSIFSFLTSVISALSQTSAENEDLNAGQDAESPSKVPSSGNRSVSTLTMVLAPIDTRKVDSLPLSTCASFAFISLVVDSHYGIAILRYLISMCDALNHVKCSRSKSRRISISSFSHVLFRSSSSTSLHFLAKSLFM